MTNNAQLTDITDEVNDNYEVLIRKKKVITAIIAVDTVLAMETDFRLCFQHPLLRRQLWKLGKSTGGASGPREQGGRLMPGDELIVRPCGSKLHGSQEYYDRLREFCRTVSRGCCKAS